MNLAKMLIVVEDKNTRDLLASCLEETGAEVLAVSGFSEALALAQSRSLDMVFSCLISEHQSGLDFLLDLRKTGFISPLILITDLPDLDTITAALRFGAFDCLTKPVTRETVLDVADRALALRRKELGQEDRRLQLESLFESIHDGLLTVDRNLRVTSRNQAAQTLCRLAAGQVADFASGKPCQEQCLVLLRQALDCAVPVVCEHLSCGEPGRVRALSVRATPLLRPDGACDGAVLLLHEKSQRVPTFAARQQFGRLVGKSERMQEIYSLVDVLAEVDTTVLITGESGTGKELIAEALHYNGRRAGKPLIKVNCAALSATLFESELFGHVKGAFTGAETDKIGRFQKAHGGTIFLDEIGDLPPLLQVRLLRVLQEKSIERVGDSTPIKVDVRILAATNQDLLQKVRQGTFREDLYYRFKVVNVDLPPLRKRKEDLPGLLEHFRVRFNQQHGRNISSFSEEVLLAFLRYDWPGNVRELEHAVEHAAVLCKSATINARDIPAEVRALSSESRYIRRDEADQAESLRCALEKSGGNKAKAARLLGVSRQTLYRKLAELGFDIEEEGLDSSSA